MMAKRIELLAPAGGAEALRAAVCAGADAVYLGYSAFGARASAANFDAEALERAVAYAHLYHVRVHVTVNTLVKPGEMEAVAEALGVIEACHADAILVQDMGVALLARERFPALRLHASTQMALHTASGARMAMAAGFERVVLARECTLQTIREVVATGVETEVFAHGALCAGVSGQCLMSALAGGRSGNRGRCAQPCRQQVTLHGRTGALLSMRDLYLRERLPELIAAGVRSLKIEGRLKSPEYVATVTDSYRRALRDIEAGRFVAEDERERASLAQIFNRGGFTRGHAFAAEDAELCATERVSHEGIALGTVQDARGGFCDVRVRAALHDGDSLQLRGESDAELRYAGPETPAGGIARLRLRAGIVTRRGDEVRRLADATQLERARAMTEPTIPITMRAAVWPNKPIALTVSDGASAVTVTGENAQTPVTRAVSDQEVRRQLGKLGDTPFSLAAPEHLSLGEAFVPLSALNALRRDALSRLMDARRARFESDGRFEADSRDGRDARFESNGRDNGDEGDGRESSVSRPPVAHPSAALPSAALQTALPPLTTALAVSFPDAAMGRALLDAGATMLVYAPRDLRPEALARALPLLPPGAYLELPPQLSDAAYQALRPLLTGSALAGAVLGSVGQLGFDLPLPVALGVGVPVTNRLALRALLSRRPDFFTLWPELSADELRALAPGDAACLLGVYGRERLMLLNHCPERVARGLSRGRERCALCKAEGWACGAPDACLTDRKGYRFPLTRTIMPEGCVVNVLGALPTDLRRYDGKRRELGAGMLLRMTVEPPDQQLALTRAFRALADGREPPPSPAETTVGRFLSGVE